MKWSWSIGRIAGIQVRMHWTFLLLLAYIVFIYSSRGESWGATLLAIAFVLTIFACIVLHEAGHALMARRYGVATEDITLLPIGGVARMQRIPSEPWHEFWIAVAGPAVNIAISMVLLLILIAIGSIGLPSGLAGIGNFLASLLAVNVVLVLFNVLPAFPMDGGRVLRALLATRMDYLKATNIAASIGQGMAILFGIVGLFWNPWLLFIALFVYLGAEGEAQMVRVRSLLGDARVRDAMLTRFRVLSPQSTLRQAVDELLAGSQHDFPVADDAGYRGLLRRQDLIAALKEHGPERLVIEAVASEELHPASANDPLNETMERMRRDGAQVVPVLDGKVVVGLLTMENVAELILIRSAERHLDGPQDPHQATQAA